MHFSLKQEQLRQLLKKQHEYLQRTFAFDRQRGLLALVHASNLRYLEIQHNNAHASSFYLPGLQKALSLCFSTQDSQASTSTDTLNMWANSTLQECSRLVEAERILSYCDTGFMSMQQGNDTNYSVWIASKRMSTEWRELEDLAAWTQFLQQTYASEMHALQIERIHILQQLAAFVSQWDGQACNLYATARTIDGYYHRLGVLHAKKMVPYTTYPSAASIGGCTFAVYRDVLSTLLGLALKHLDACQIVLNSHLPHTLQSYVTMRHNDTLLIKTLAATLALDSATVRLALDAYTLDAENISYHSSVAEVPAAPLIRLDEQHRVVLLSGLFTQPLFFLTRELKRKYSYEYHTASQLREEIFRQDVYTLFADKRFSRSVGHVELRGVKGTLTTDVDALIFDRKTGALALFELKSQDPFAYSQQERMRQRDYFYAASKQVIASSEWIKRNGANALLERLDSTRIKRFKAQKVYIFVVGRYLAHFFDGPPFDVRAAWGTWSQVLCLVHGKAFGAVDANPIQSLYNKLVKDTPLALPASLHLEQEVVIGQTRIRVYPSFEAFKHNDV